MVFCIEFVRLRPGFLDSLHQSVQICVQCCRRIVFTTGRQVQNKDFTLSCG